MKNILFFTFSISFFTQIAFAHGGGLNSEGCHTNQKTGEYHCHRAQSFLQPTTPHQQPQDAGQRHSPTCYTGPKGGTYTISPSGKKNYNGC